MVNNFELGHIFIYFEGERVNPLFPSLKVNKRYNEHSIVEMEFDFDKDLFYQTLLPFATGEKEQFKLCFRDVHTENSAEVEILVGYIETMEIEKIMHNWRCRFKAISYSKKMDIKKKKKIYQDATMNMSSLFSQVGGSYQNISLNASANDCSMSGITVQYRETDWEMLKRVASRNGKALITAGETVFLGLPSTEEKEVNMNRAKFGFYLNNCLNSRAILHSYEMFEVGDNLSIARDESTEKFSVIAVEINLNENNLITADYELEAKEKFKVKKIYNKNLRGLSLECKISNVESSDDKARVEIKFYKNLDNKQISNGESGGCAGSFQFPYKTPFATSHTGMFCTPKIDDNAIFYIPEKEEKNGFVVACVNNDSSGRFSNLNSRKFITGGQTNLLFTPSTYEFNSGADLNMITENIKLNSGEMTTISSSATQNIKSDGNLDIESSNINPSGGTVNYEGSSSLKIISPSTSIG